MKNKCLVNAPGSGLGAQIKIPGARSPEPGASLRIGYTLGDLAGIGQEIFYKFKELYKDKPALEIVLIDSKEDVANTLSQITMGKASAHAGEHAYKVLEQANTLACNGDIDFLITGPVAKESLWMAGIQCTGQTELLAKINKLNRDDIEMFFILEQLRMVLATRHIPIADVPKTLKRRLEIVLENSITALKNIYNINSPRIAVAGLNPHAGENDILGREENQFIKPIIEEFKNKTGTNISGPYPADSLFASAAQQWLRAQGSGLEGNKDNDFNIRQKSISLKAPSPEPRALSLDYDLYVAAFHDQALPVIKGIGGLNAINLTTGLPFIRLSVDHGTGFDIVGMNIASPQGLIACTDYCFSLRSSKIARVSTNKE